MTAFQRNNTVVFLLLLLPFAFISALSLSGSTQKQANQLSRKTFLVGSVASTLPFLVTQEKCLAEDQTDDPKTFTRIKDKQFGYTLTLPMEPSPGNKPLQTHLDEVNLSTGTKGYSYGITVDPIRLNSLREFGTPNEVAAKIVMAELKRDGIMDVTMGRDPTEDSATGGYDVEYISDGKRGKKHIYTRTIVSGGKLYVLTVQCKQDDWEQVENDVINSVGTFRVLGL
jgi:hypothetical protein